MMSREASLLSTPSLLTMLPKSNHDSKSFRLLKTCGSRKLRRLHSSARLFCSGVPAGTHQQLVASSHALLKLALFHHASTVQVRTAQDFKTFGGSSAVPCAMQCCAASIYALAKGR